MAGHSCLGGTFGLGRFAWALVQLPVGQGDDREPVVAIVLVELDVAKGICRLMTQTATLISLHALGRWFQRSFDNGEIALWSDLRGLAIETGRLLESRSAADNSSVVYRAGSGQWVGTLTEHPSEATGRPEKVVSVRTFIPK